MVKAVVEFEYDAELPDELSLRKGDIITNIKKQDGGWWEGTVNGKTGVFPDNFVKEIPDDTPKKSAPAVIAAPLVAPPEVKSEPRIGHASIEAKKANVNVKALAAGAQPPLLGKKTAGKTKRARVTFAYAPEQPDEVELRLGDIVEIVKQEEEGWWEGIVNGKQGVFPSNFVEIIDIDDQPQDNETSTNVNDTAAKKLPGVMGYGDIFKGGQIQLKPSKENPVKVPAKDPVLTSTNSGNVAPPVATAGTGRGISSAPPPLTNASHVHSGSVGATPSDVPGTGKKKVSTHCCSTTVTNRGTAAACAARPLAAISHAAAQAALARLNICSAGGVNDVLSNNTDRRIMTPHGSSAGTHCGKSSSKIPLRIGKHRPATASADDSESSFSCISSQASAEKKREVRPEGEIRKEVTKLFHKAVSYSGNSKTVQPSFALGGKHPRHDDADDAVSLSQPCPSSTSTAALSSSECIAHLEVVEMLAKLMAEQHTTNASTTPSIRVSNHMATSVGYVPCQSDMNAIARTSLSIHSDKVDVSKVLPQSSGVDVNKQGQLDECLYASWSTSCAGKMSVSKEKADGHNPNSDGLVPLTLFSAATSQRTELDKTQPLSSSAVSLTPSSDGLITCNFYKNSKPEMVAGNQSLTGQIADVPSHSPSAGSSAMSHACMAPSKHQCKSSHKKNRSASKCAKRRRVKERKRLKAGPAFTLVVLNADQHSLAPASLQEQPACSSPAMVAVSDPYSSSNRTLLPSEISASINADVVCTEPSFMVTLGSSCHEEVKNCISSASTLAGIIRSTADKSVQCLLLLPGQDTMSDRCAATMPALACVKAIGSSSGDPSMVANGMPDTAEAPSLMTAAIDELTASGMQQHLDEIDTELHAMEAYLQKFKPSRSALSEAEQHGAFHEIAASCLGHGGIISSPASSKNDLSLIDPAAVPQQCHKSQYNPESQAIALVAVDEHMSRLGLESDLAVPTDAVSNAAVTGKTSLHKPSEPEHSDTATNIGLTTWKMTADAKAKLTAECCNKEQNEAPADEVPLCGMPHTQRLLAWEQWQAQKLQPCNSRSILQSAGLCSDSIPLEAADNIAGPNKSISFAERTNFVEQEEGFCSRSDANCNFTAHALSTNMSTVGLTAGPPCLTQSDCGCTSSGYPNVCPECKPTPAANSSEVSALIPTTPWLTIASWGTKCLPRQSMKGQNEIDAGVHRRGASPGIRLPSSTSSYPFGHFSASSAYPSRDLTSHHPRMQVLTTAAGHSSYSTELYPQSDISTIAEPSNVLEQSPKPPKRRKSLKQKILQLFRRRRHHKNSCEQPVRGKVTVALSHPPCNSDLNRPNQSFTVSLTSPCVQVKGNNFNQCGPSVAVASDAKEVPGGDICSTSPTVLLQPMTNTIALLQKRSANNDDRTREAANQHLEDSLDIRESPAIVKSKTTVALALRDNSETAEHTGLVFSSQPEPTTKKAQSLRDVSETEMNLATCIDMCQSDSRSQCAVNISHESKGVTFPGYLRYNENANENNWYGCASCTSEASTCFPFLVADCGKRGCGPVGKAFLPRHAAENNAIPDTTNEPINNSGHAVLASSDSTTYLPALLCDRRRCSYMRLRWLHQRYNILQQGCLLNTSREGSACACAGAEHGTQTGCPPWSAV